LNVDKATVNRRLKIIGKASTPSPEALQQIREIPEIDRHWTWRTVMSDENQADVAPMCKQFFSDRDGEVHNEQDDDKEKFWIVHDDEEFSADFSVSPIVRDESER
jgi:hypothetical protein